MKKGKTKLLVTSIILLFVFVYPVVAADYTSDSFILKDPVINTGTANSNSANFGLGQSISQTATGKSTSINFQLWSGFQYYFKVNTNTVTATPGDAQVSLNWTVPQTFLGIAVSSYEVGVGTVSGSYVFSDVGNVTTYNKTGLTNNTPYFFKIKAKSAGGLFLVFSNQATATPIASVTPPPPPPGGGGGGGNPIPNGTAGIILSGLAYPGRIVTILRDGAIVATTLADPGAAFNITLGSLAAGTYNISVYATDENGKRSPTISLSQTLTDNVISRVDNLFLGPTLGVSHSIIKKGDILNIFGFTAPQSEVTIVTHSNGEHIDKVTASGTGSYFKAFNTIVLDFGSHKTASQSAKNNLVSPASVSADFQVADKSIETPEGECGRSDLNCDGRINLTDFSIMLFYWQQANPANARADINQSGLVDLTDFSIMLFDWTG